MPSTDFSNPFTDPRSHASRACSFPLDYTKGKVLVVSFETFSQVSVHHPWRVPSPTSSTRTNSIRTWVSTFRILPLWIPIINPLSLYLQKTFQKTAFTNLILRVKKSLWWLQLKQFSKELLINLVSISTFRILSPLQLISILWFVTNKSSHANHTRFIPRELH